MAGSIYMAPGEAEGAGGISGAIILDAEGYTRNGTIEFRDGSQGKPGDVWTATDAIGTGSWAPSRGAVNYLSNPSPKKDTVGWTTSANNFTLTSIDALGDSVTVRRQYPTVPFYEGQPLYYTGLAAGGGLTLGTVYYVKGNFGNIGGYDSFGLSTTPGGATFNIVSGGSMNLSAFYAYQPMTNNFTPVLSTWTRDVTNKIGQGPASFAWTKPASLCLGEMVFTPFTIPKGRQATIIQLDFLNGPLSGTYVDKDMGVFVRDVTNNTLISVSASSIMKRGQAGPVQYMEFQAAYNSTSYELYVMNTSITGNAFTLIFDEFGVGPKSKSVGAIVTDWVEYSLTIGGVITKYNCCWDYFGAFYCV